MAKTTSKNSIGKAVAIGAGIAALSASAYLLFGPDGKKNRKAVKGWTVKMKGEVMEKMENLKEVTAPIYEKIVADVSSKYAKMKNVSPEELKAAVAGFKKDWKGMMKTVKKPTKPAKKVAAKKRGR